MKLAFYRAKYGDWKDWLIAFWTRSEFSHVELQVDENVFFSSSPRDGEVRYTYFKPKEEHWEFVDVPPSLLDALCDERIKSVLRGKYDWLGIFLYEFIPLNIQRDNHWWCSEVVAYVLNFEDYRVSPEELYQIVKEIK